MVTRSKDWSEKGVPSAFASTNHGSSSVIGGSIATVGRRLGEAALDAFALQVSGASHGQHFGRGIDAGYKSVGTTLSVFVSDRGGN